jgi:predicted ATP-dependent serine protease
MTSSDWKPYTAKGRITLLSVAPKAGKSTLAAYYAVAKATGGVWLDQRLERGRVLWCGPDEHLGDIAARFKRLDAPADQIEVWVAPSPDPRAIADQAAEFGASLIVLDTLTRIAEIEDENDAAKWTTWFNSALPSIRDSDAGWLAIHHDRKSGGEHGEAIRGSSAIFASVDIAISLRRVKEENFRRILRIEGTRYESAEDAVIELREDGQYVRLGDPKKVRAGEDPDLANVMAILGTTPQTALEVENAVSAFYMIDEAPGQSTIRRLLNKAVELGWARREGRGGPKDVFRWSRGSLAPIKPTGSRPQGDGAGAPV